MSNFYYPIKNKNVLVMGLGLVGGGLGVVKWLHDQGAQITITDLRDKKTLSPSLKKLSKYPIKYILGQHRDQDFQNADLIIKNPAVPIDSPYLKIAKKYRVPITTDIELFAQRWPGEIIAITGTKGKSTTVNLIYRILKQAKKSCCLGGNVGETPLLSLKNARPNQIAVLELSSFQLENLKIKPDISLITNIFPDHLNRHKTMAEYTAIKTNVFKNQLASQYAILNYDHKVLRKMTNQVPSKLVFFSTQTIVRPKNCEILFGIKNNQIIVVNKKYSQTLCSLNKIKLLGQHNLENILGAVAIAYLSGVDKSILQKSINNFSGVSNRLELVRIINGAKYFNDTTATNPGATIAALNALSNERNAKRIILIAGGADKNLSFNELAPKIKKTCKQVIMLSGTATPKFIQTLKKTKYPTNNIVEFNDLERAITFCKKIAQNGDIVLLSPACASFGMFTPLEIKRKMFKVKDKVLQEYILKCIKKWGVKSLTGFKNEFDRGQQFVKIVKNI